MAGNGNQGDRIKTLEETQAKLIEVLKKHGIHLPAEEGETEAKKPDGWDDAT